MTSPLAPPPMTPPASTPVWTPPPPRPAPQKRVIQRMGVLSVAKLYGVMLAAIGLLIGIFVALIALSVGSMASEMGADEMGAAEVGLMAGVGVFAIVLFPLLYGLMGFIFGALSAILYNVFAKWMGGIEVEVV